MKLSMLALGAALSMQIASQGAFAQAVLEDTKKAEPPKAAQPDQDAMMEQLAERTAPGKEHKLLEPMHGEWDVNATFWMTPGEAPSEMKAKAKSEWILGDRFLKMTFTGDFFGMPFEGNGLTGFNRVSGQYETVWMDNANTGMSTGFGSVSADGKTFTFHSEFDDPFTGSKKKTREVIVIESKDKYTMASYEMLPNGSEHKSMNIVYTRAKN